MRRRARGAQPQERRVESVSVRALRGTTAGYSARTHTLNPSVMHPFKPKKKGDILSRGVSLSGHRVSTTGGGSLLCLVFLRKL